MQPAATRPAFRSAGNALGIASASWNSNFLRACRGEPTAHTPIWLMRQAGRYMDHYRGLRARLSFLDLCRNPSAAAEAALYAREWLNVDAAIVFSDILVVLQALGMELSFQNDGPKLVPLDGAAAVARLRDPLAAAADLGYVAEAVRLTVAGLPADIPCIGFAGAPFTLAAYAIEGGGSRQFTRAKSFMYREPAAWHRLSRTIAICAAEHANRQIAAGATAIQFFDSWAGCLSRADFEEFALPHLTTAVQAVKPGVPVIVFGAATGHLLDLFARTGADVIGVDTGASLSSAWDTVGGPGRVAVQGNLDPAVLLGPVELVRARTDLVLAEAAKRPGHIFNLGHGIIKETPPEMARELVSYVHERTAR
ncbi:MAG: uroporphyrinogen decarboxylase [Planctomycetota bacterium]